MTTTKTTKYKNTTVTQPRATTEVQKLSGHILAVFYKNKHFQVRVEGKLTIDVEGDCVVAKSCYEDGVDYMEFQPTDIERIEYITDQVCIILKEGK